MIGLVWPLYITYLYEFKLSRYDLMVCDVSFFKTDGLLHNFYVMCFCLLCLFVLCFYVIKIVAKRYAGLKLAI